MDFVKLLDSVVPTARQFQGTLLCLDPGETTGYVALGCSSGKLPTMVEYGELPSDPIEHATDLIEEKLRLLKPNHLVYEDYRVYSWRSAAHSWSALHTPQLIGSIRTLCRQKGVLTTHHMAHEAKTFVTDDKLREWHMYKSGQKHARDALRHGLFYLLFTHKKRTNI